MAQKKASLTLVVFLVITLALPVVLVRWGVLAVKAREVESDQAAVLQTLPTATPEAEEETSEIITPTVITAVSLNPSTGDLTITHGPVSGEVTAESAVLWARGSEAGELAFTIAPVTDPDFEGDLITAETDIDETTDFTGEVWVDGLEPATAYYYRVVLTVDEETSKYVQGYFTTSPAEDELTPFSFVFGSCLGGQGFCRDPETGWYIFNTMLAQNPNFFLITGDSVYVDSACTTPANVAGSVGPFSDLTGFRSRYRYHLADDNYANFLAQTPVYVNWDDHEIRDDFGGPALSRVNPQLFADGTQAFFEYWPLLQGEETQQIYRTFTYGQYAQFIVLDTRSYRDPNVNWDPHPRNITPKTMLGAEQFAWLQETLKTSTAVWKFIVTSTPLSYPTGFPQPEVDGRDGWANYTEPSGYETELLSLLFFIESQDIENVVFLSGDTHWPFALSYDPDHDGLANFYELGSSPMSAINLPPVEKPDPSFNPTVLYAEGEFNGTLFNFGHIVVEENGRLTFQIIDRDGVEHYNLTLDPILPPEPEEE